MKRIDTFYRRSGVQEKLFFRTTLLIFCPPVLNSAVAIGVMLIYLALCAVPSAAQAARGSVTRSKAVELFVANCQICHGANGEGTPLMKELAFKERGKWKHGNRQADVVKTITNGVPATAMMPFKGRLTPAEINALASLVRSFDRTTKPAAAGAKR
jgi:mono/diheme cytochrome c family protein